MSKLFLLAFGIVFFLFAGVADAQTTPKIYWMFYVLNGAYEIPEDYSIDLGQDQAVSLPRGMINEGWSCIREAVKEDGVGKFSCRNKTVNFSIAVSCANLWKKPRIEEMQTMTINYENNHIDFFAQCVAYNE